MIFSNNPGITPDQVEDILKQSCTDLGISGVDYIFGYGRVNLNAAMHAAPPPPPFTLTIDGECPGWLTITWWGATHDSTIALLFAKNMGQFRIPSGSCRGTVLGLGTQALQLMASFPAGSNGSGSHNGITQQSACLGYLQMIELPSCNLTGTVQIP